MRSVNIVNTLSYCQVIYIVGIRYLVGYIVLILIKIRLEYFILLKLIKKMIIFKARFEIVPSRLHKFMLFWAVFIFLTNPKLLAYWTLVVFTRSTFAFCIAPIVIIFKFNTIVTRVTIISISTNVTSGTSTKVPNRCAFNEYIFTYRSLSDQSSEIRQKHFFKYK